MTEQMKMSAFAAHIGCPVTFIGEDGKRTHNGVLVGINTKLLTDLIVLESMDNNTPIYKCWCSKDTRLILRDPKLMESDEFITLLRTYNLEFQDSEIEEALTYQSLIYDCFFNENYEVAQNTLHPLYVLAAYDYLRSRFFNVKFMGFSLEKHDVAIMEHYIIKKQ